MNICNRAVKIKIKENTGNQKIQDSYKNTGIYRMYRTGGNTVNVTKFYHFNDSDDQ